LLVFLASSGHFGWGSSMILYSNKSSTILDKFQSGNEYFLSWGSFNVGRFFVNSLEDEALFPFGMDFPKILMGSLVKTIIVSFVEVFGGLELFLE